MQGTKLEGKSSARDFKYGCFTQSDLIITFLKRWLKFIKIQSNACQDLKTLYYFNSCIMMRKNMFCFNLSGEEIWHLARLQGGKFSLVPTPSKWHPASHCLGAKQGSWQINSQLALKPSCFWVSGQVVICKRAVGKTGKNLRGRAEQEHDILPICK